MNPNVEKTHHTFRPVFQDLLFGIGKILKGELHLAVSETRFNLKRTSVYSRMLAIAAVLATAALLFFLVFMVVGLGDALGGNYWLSALILMVVFGGVAAVLGAAGLKKMKEIDYGLPETRKIIREESEQLPPLVNFAAARIVRALAKSPEPKVDPERALVQAKLEVAEGRDIIRDAAEGFTLLKREWLAREADVERALKKVLGASILVLPGIAAGYYGSRMALRRRGLIAEV